ncbi:MAG TPA: 30S ribosomal protein S3 [archaeon]|nr:30S ribosomal protein S3 [archaeon]
MIEKYFVKQSLNKVELDNYLAKELDKAGFTKSEIVKTPLVTRIVVNVTRPGLAIGKSGTNIAMLTETIGKRFGIDNPQLEIKEIERPELDAQAVANRFKAVIERGFSWRSVIFKGLNDILRAGAQGAEIVVSGKLAGKGGRKKQVRVGSGYMKKVGEQARLVDYGQAAAYPKVGAIGIKVKIVKPDTIFPDKERIQPYIKKKEDAAAKGVAAQKAEEAKAAAPEAEKAEEVKAEVAKDEAAKPEIKKETPAAKKEHKAEKKEHAEKKVDVVKDEKTAAKVEEGK